MGLGMCAAAAKSHQSCLTLYDPIDGSPPGSPVPGILQARTLEWVAISFFNAWKWKVKMKSLSSVRLLATPWTAAYQAPPSMGFSRQEYWSGVPLPSPWVCVLVLLLSCGRDCKITASLLERVVLFLKKKSFKLLPYTLTEQANWNFFLLYIILGLYLCPFHVWTHL